jgi:ArsR family transcriptional regulator
MDVTLPNRVNVIKALAHPARLQMAEALAESSLCVGELQAIVGADISTVSKHLSIMRKSGWVDCEKRGLHIYYHLACDCLQEFLRCVDTLAEKEKCDC